MNHIKKHAEFSAINEMAKGFPPGTIVKVTNPSRLGYSSGSSYRGGDNWSTFTPEQIKGMSGGLFYMEVKDSGRIWLEGPIIYANGLTNSNVLSYKARVAASSAESPGDEYRIFKKNDTEIKALLNKSFFMDGSEPGIMDNEGKPATITEAEYAVSGLNFKLTDLYDEPVFFLIKKQGTKNTTSVNFSIKMSDLTGATKELDKEQKEVIAEWFSKEMETTVVVDGERYKIEYVKVTSSSSDTYPSNFNAGPFANKDQAEKYIKLLEKESVTLFDPSSLRVTDGGYPMLQLNLEEMMAFAKAIGVTTTMKQLLALKKGAVAGKKFGL